MDGAPFLWAAGKKIKKTRPAPNCAQAMPHPTYVVNCIEYLCFGAVQPNSSSMESVFSSCNSVYGLLYWINRDYTRDGPFLNKLLIRYFSFCTVPPRTAQVPVHDFQKPADFQRLGYMLIHSRLFGPVHVVGKCVCRKGDNGNPSPVRTPAGLPRLRIALAAV